MPGWWLPRAATSRPRTLALAPLVKAGAVLPSGIVVDAASGVSGAGRKLTEGTQFCTVDEDFTAYGLLKHRHTPEMEQAIGAQLIFTPHLAPMNRGILATCYARPTSSTGVAPLEVLADAYASEPFVVVSSRSPSTKAALGSNTAHLTALYDERDRLGRLHMRPRQPRQRCVRPSGPVRQRSHGLARDHGPPAGWPGAVNYYAQ